MRVAVAYHKNGCENVKNIASHLARGIESQGHQVNLINIETDSDAKLTIYEYLLIGTAPNSAFSGKINAKVADYLKNAGKVSGTKCYAFTAKKGFFSNKALQNLMKSMEKEGMFLKVSDVITGQDEAELIGKKLHIK